MRRRVAALAAAGVLLAGCTSQSASRALSDWVSQSAFHSAVATLRSDARHALTALRDSSSPANLLHTVCGVLDLDAESANASLPSPDAESTTLLSRAYDQLGTGASRCYAAAASPAKRALAISDIERGAATLAEAAARVSSAS
ncbi:MAG TPA: hypothetical protein VGS61_07945 [Acidimicrobiales bacterium]|nr:hypothetical protein [Acidimicrobiales bacterium]